MTSPNQKLRDREDGGEMIFKKKSWYWSLTYPFAHNNYTTILDTCYCPHEGTPPAHIICHEKIHSRQQRQVGLYKFIFLYLFALPILWNPWRYKWEIEAYTQGSGITEEKAQELLSSRAYGWLKNRRS